MSPVATRASIKYLSIKFFLKFFSVSWSTTHSENWESWNLPQPFFTNGSSPHKNYLCLKLFNGGETFRICRKKKTLVTIIFLMFICNKWNNTPSTHSIFCNSLLLLFHQLLSMLDALRSCSALSLPFATFSASHWFISGWLQCLARFAFHFRGKCFGRKMPWYSLWH